MTYYSNRNRYAYVSAWSGEEHCIIVIYVVICYGLISLYSNNRKKKKKKNLKHQHILFTTIL